MKKYYLIFLAGGLILFSCKKEKTNHPVNLKCESEINPMGIDNTQPYFSWQSDDTSKGAAQTAYQIIVASDENLILNRKADIWNPGKVSADQSQFIIYEGKPLEPAKRYYWAVQTWNNEGNRSEFSKPAWFETGLMKVENWKAEWIRPSKTLQKEASVLFRKEFKINKKISKARAYTTGLGAYVLYINGERIGNQQLAPGWNNFNKRIQYQAYDITAQLCKGNNAIGVITGNFWTSAENSKTITDLRFIMQLKIVFTDGSEEWIYSGTGWKVHPSPVTECSYGIGEKYDARLLSKGWNKQRFNEKGWINVLTEKNKYNLVCRQMQPIIIKNDIKPVKITNINNRYIADMGETLPGWLKIKVKCKKGTIIKLRYLSAYNIKENKEGKTTGIDEYICKGIGNEEWEPSFAYHVFHYVEITGLSNKPGPKDIVARVVYPDIGVTGNFKCSSNTINNIYNNIVRTGRNNMVSLLTGFPGEHSRIVSPVSVQAYCKTALYIFDIGKGFNKYLHDLCDIQTRNGKIKLLPGNDNGTSSPGWDDVIVILPWKTFIATGNKEILSKNYDAIKAWHNSQVRESDVAFPPYMHDRPGNGDLCSLDSTPVKPIGSVYYFYSTSLLSNIADVLEKFDESTGFMELSGFTKDQFNQSYLKYRNARYWAATQTSHVLTLAAGIVPLSHVQRVADFIASDIKKHNLHPTTGVLSTQFLLPLLSEYNHHDLAYQLLTQTTKPSWGYMLNNGSSVIWGSWDRPDEASAYQPALASVGEWLYAYLAGINPDEKFPGYKHSIITPAPVNNLKWAGAALQTGYGDISVHWEKQNAGLIVTVIIPANTWSTLNLPVKNTDKAKIILDGTEIMNNGKFNSGHPEYISFKGFDGNKAVIEVKSGKYKFIIE